MAGEVHGALHLRFLAEASEQLDGVRDADRALKIALRLAMELFDAEEGCIARSVPGRPRVEPAIQVPQGRRWDAALLTRYLAERRPKMPPGALIAPLVRRGRPWAVLALRRTGPGYEPAEAREAGRVADHLSRVLARIDEERAALVRERIDRKVLEQIRPSDLFYQILHGLRTLTRYDHSAAVLIRDASSGALRVVAERLEWRKGKSSRVGLVRPLDAAAAARLEEGRVRGFDRVRGRWRPWDGGAGAELAEALDHDGGGGRREACLLVAPLATREGTIGLLQVASCHPGSMGAFEAELVRRFLPQAATAIRNLERAATLEESVLEAERRTVVANLARGVSHDVNNALGSVLPLVQQMLDDARRGPLPPDVLHADLEQIHASLQVCRRIFGGMLGFARSERMGLGEGNVRRALESTLAVLEDGLRRRRVRVRVDVPESVPTIRGPQGDLEQLLLNLATNARDAMPDGGELRVTVRPEDEAVRVEIADTGCGIPPEHLKRVKEPFFTTKPDGSGLGLSICRSIVWNLRGTLAIESEVDAGTRVRLTLPVAADGEEPA